MLNTCIFIFILYAMSYSVKVILFGKKRKQRRKKAVKTVTMQKRRKRVTA